MAPSRVMERKTNSEPSLEVKGSSASKVCSRWLMREKTMVSPERTRRVAEVARQRPAGKLKSSVAHL